MHLAKLYSLLVRKALDDFFYSDREWSSLFLKSVVRSEYTLDGMKQSFWASFSTSTNVTKYYVFESHNNVAFLP